MHKLMEYVCDELDELERKADKDGKLSMTEIQYADMLTNMKKNLLKSEMLMNENKYSMMNDPYHGSYARGGRGGRRGENQYGSYAMEGYSRDSEEMIEQLRDLMQDAPDERTRKEFERFIHKVEQM